jgi:uncharacterized protein
MRLLAQHLRLAATDLSNHLACHHLTTLDLSVARGQCGAPARQSPDLAVIQELGLRHEATYLRFLQDQGLSFVELRGFKDDQGAIAETVAAMKRGVDVIAQGTLAHGRWFGKPDVLRRIATPSRFGDWSYEVYDCKLTQETKAATLLQLALYSELLTQFQGEPPEVMYVIPGGAKFEAEPYRCAEYAAYYRYVKDRLERACDNGRGDGTYPEPCAHCDVCRWFKVCDGRRRADDNTSLVAGITRLQRNQLDEWQTDTMAKLAILPLPLQHKPSRGSKEGYQRVREQARLQVEARTLEQPVHELLAVTAEMGFCKLPEPSRLDMFVDLEGDPFAAGGTGQEYLFGFVAADDEQRLHYRKQWCLTADEEKRAFEWLVDEIMRRWQADPTMHVYHFGAYEATHFKSLMGRYATREEEIDRMLRAKLLVDLHTVFKQGVRAGVEEYTLKKLEVFHEFKRKISLDESRAAMRYIEHWLELSRDGELRAKERATMEGYNEDDCGSTASLRNWLEAERRKLEDSGTNIPRLAIGDGAPPEDLDERQKQVAALVAHLLEGIPVDPARRSDDQASRWILAQLMDWHRRENKASWWEGYRLADLDDDDLLDERVGLSGLQFVERVSVERQIPTDRYTFVKQETEVRPEKDMYHRDEHIGCVVAIDAVNRTVDIKKKKKTAEIHPSSAYAWDKPFGAKEQADALFRIGAWVADNQIDAPGPYRAARDLLLRRPPRLAGNETLAARTGENTEATACRVAGTLDHSVFAIQGPPGAGKTYTGARMIRQLVRRGQKIGVTALSHRVIRNLLKEIVDAAAEDKLGGVRCMQRTDDEEGTPEIAVAKNNAEALQALRSGTANVVGGTSWVWSPKDFEAAVDVLFIDEAGQMALADVMAVAQSAKNLVLIGDPQQLERPLKGSHPAGAEVSALQYLLGDHKTIPETMGLLLPETHRMHPKICAFTSELFYERRLQALDITRHQLLEGHPWLNGAGLWFVPVKHEANRNSSPQEVEVITQIVDSLMAPGVEWFRSIGNSAPLQWEDILIVAPYNAQVSDIMTRLPNAKVGTVDKFQGQQAPVVIYSLTTSSPEDAPRGMEFLFSLNRLNVATSRGKSHVIIVGNPRLFEPECKTPRQMQLANAFCRYLELATVHRTAGA